MYLITVWVASAIITLGSLWYCFLIWRRRVHPSLASFLIFSISFPLGFWMYMQNPHWSWGGNIGVLNSIVSTWMISATLFIRLIKDGKLSVELNKPQRRTIYASIVILIFWVITRDHLTAYILLQASILIGYVAMVKKFWNWQGKNPDSITFWLLNFLGTLVAVYAAIERNDLESWIYILRALPCMLFLIFILLRLEMRMKRQQVQG